MNEQDLKNKLQTQSNVQKKQAQRKARDLSAIEAFKLAEGMLTQETKQKRKRAKK